MTSPSFDHLFKDIEDDIQKLAPTVIIKGWWWKKYFEKYRLQKDFMDYVLREEWKKKTKEISDELIYGTRVEEKDYRSLKI